MFMSLDLASRMRAAESSAPCSTPSNWTRECGTHAELAQAMKTYNSAPKTKDAWASSGGMPMVAGTKRAEMAAHAGKFVLGK